MDKTTNNSNLTNLDLTNLDLSVLQNLTEEEKTSVFSILQEIADKGESTILDSLKYEDYEEVPVDILTFIDDDKYLGKAWKNQEGKSMLYNYWRKELPKIFPNNLDTDYNNLILTGSRGRGKSEMAASAIAPYLLYRVLCLKNPVEHFQLKNTEKLVFAFMNIKLDLAEEIATTKFQNTIQQSPWFLQHGTIEGRTNKVWKPKKFLNSEGQEVEAIDIKIGSGPSDVIGLPIYFAFFDEISFIKNKSIEEQKKKALDMINTALGGMKTRFVSNGKNPTVLVLASSKRSDKSFLEDHMKTMLKNDDIDVYISDGPVWEVKPEKYTKPKFLVGVGNKFLDSVVIPKEADPEEYRKKGYQLIEVPGDFKSDFLMDIDRALCDYAGISSSNSSKYISAIAFNETINANLKNPFPRDILEIGNGPDDDRQYYDFFDLSKMDPKLKSKPLFIHLDMSVSGDKTGIAGVFIKGKKPSIVKDQQDLDLFFSLAFAISIKAPKGRQISFEKNRNFIYWLKANGFNIQGITSDTFQSYDTGQALKARGYKYDVLSVDRVDPGTNICKPYQSFRTAIYEKRIETFEDKLLFTEVTELERDLSTGKIDHPSEGCFTGDTKVKLVDGRSLSFFDLVKEYEDGKENYVYSINLDSKKIEPKKILKAWKTLENQPLVKLTFDNGEVVECTLNHKFMLRNGEYIEAQDLIPGDSLMSLDVDHFIKCIEFIDKRADVYDIEVEHNHNFALDAGIFVHNSKDKSDAVCGAVYNAGKFAEQYAYDYGEQAEDILRYNSENLASYDKQQLTLDLEEELKKIGRTFHSTSSSLDEGTTDYYLLTDDIIIY